MAQLLHKNRQDEHLLDKFEFVRNGPEASGSLYATTTQLQDLSRLLLGCLSIIIVLDGIDECRDDETLIQDLLWVSANTPTKILLFGRLNTESLLRRIPAEQQLPMKRSAVSRLIEQFLTSQVCSLRDDGLLPSDSDINGLVGHLARGADGMFLWARLIVNFLRLRVLTQSTRINAIRELTLPEGLERVYSRITDTISQAGKTLLEWASKIFTLGSHSMRAITLSELYDMLVFQDGVSTENMHKRLKSFQEDICIGCGGLVEFTYSNGTRKDPVMRFIHLSVKEYFLQVGPFREHDLKNCIVSPETVSDLKLATWCLQYLFQRKPPKNLESPVEYATYESKFGPFAAYATVSWVRHLSRALNNTRHARSQNLTGFEETLQNLEPVLCAFLDDGLSKKAWIHACYMESKKVNRAVSDNNLRSHLTQLSNTLEDISCFPRTLLQLASALHAFAQKTSKIVDTWDDHMRRSIHVLWDEVTSFNAEFLDGLCKARVVSLTPDTPLAADICSSPLCTISRTTTDGSITGVLSVWPSSLFMKAQCDCEHWHNEQLDALLRGWVAKYEIRNHRGGSSIVAETVIPIRPEEILAENPARHTLEIIFPLSISNDARSFTVLRRVFTVRPEARTQSLSVESVALSFDTGNQLTVPCAYSFIFSPDDKYLFYSHWTGMAMFRLKYRPSLGSELLATDNFSSGFPSFSDAISEAIFHNSRPFIIVRAGRWVAAWKFLAKDCSVRKVKNSVSWLFNADSVHDLALSSCGDYLVFKNSPNGAPEIRRIPNYILENEYPKSSSLLPDAMLGYGEQDAMTPVSRRSNCPAATAFDLRPGQVVKATQTQSLPGETPSHITSINGGKEVMVSKTKVGAPEPTESLHIVALPQYAGIESTRPTLIPSAAGERSVRVIIDKDCEQTYRLSRPRNTELPLLIDRDISAVQHYVADSQREHIRASIDASKRLLEACRDETTEVEDKRPRKRLKM